MIRVVAVGKDIYPDVLSYQGAFAFYSTSNDRFICYDHEEVWTDWADFLEAFTASQSNNRQSREDLKRLRRLFESLEVRYENKEERKAAFPDE